MPPFTDYQRIVHRTSDLIAVTKYNYDKELAIWHVLDALERKYAEIIADETYIVRGGRMTVREDLERRAEEYEAQNTIIGDAMAILCRSSLIKMTNEELNRQIGE